MTLLVQHFDFFCVAVTLPLSESYEKETLHKCLIYLFHTSPTLSYPVPVVNQECHSSRIEMNRGRSKTINESKLSHVCVCPIFLFFLPSLPLISRTFSPEKKENRTFIREQSTKVTAINPVSVWHMFSAYTNTHTGLELLSILMGVFCYFYVMWSVSVRDNTWRKT